MTAPPIASAIRRLRFEHAEMTQAELADRIGMTRQTIAAIEHNKYSPSLEAVFRIDEVFGVAIGEVFQWKTGWPDDTKLRAATGGKYR